jgi:NodT family efflux transporter outer membrane factor (OMF) lipoprotein
LAGPLLGALLLSAGCSTLPDARPTAGPLPAQWADATALPEAADATNWWRGFNDPLLDQLIAEGLADGGGPRQALLRVKEARANSWLAVAPYLPAFSATAQAQATRSIEGRDLSGSFQSFAQGGTPVRETEQASGAAGLRISWEIPVFARIEAAVFGGRANDLLAAADLAAARATIAADIADAYVALRALQNRKTAIAESVAAADRLASILEKGATAGLIAPADAADARRLAETARAQTPDIEIAIVQARNALAILRGKAPGTDNLAEYQTQAQTPSLSVSGVPAAPADLVRLRPDVRIAEARALLAAADLGAARADLMPQINLTGAIVSMDNLIGSQLPGRMVTGEAQPLISIPLFDWGRRQAAINLRDSRFEQSLLAYRDTVNAGVGEAQLALTQLAQGTARLEASRKAEDAANANARGLRAAQEAGIASIADRLRADQQLIDSRLRRIAAEESQARAAIAVYRAFGGGPPPLDIAP